VFTSGQRPRPQRRLSPQRDLRRRSSSRRRSLALASPMTSQASSPSSPPRMRSGSPENSSSPVEAFANPSFPWPTADSDAAVGSPPATYNLAHGRGAPGPAGQSFPHVTAARSLLLRLPSHCFFQPLSTVRSSATKSKFRSPAVRNSALLVGTQRKFRTQSAPNPHLLRILDGSFGSWRDQARSAVWSGQHAQGSKHRKKLQRSRYSVEACRSEQGVNGACVLAASIGATEDSSSGPERRRGAPTRRRRWRGLKRSSIEGLGRAFLCECEDKVWRASK
jgi:hypothetical protein